MNDYKTLFAAARLTLLLTLFLLVCNLQIANAQSKAVTYPEIITALNSKVPNKTFKNKAEIIKFVIAEVKSRQVDKPLTKDFEDILRQAGATNQLIDAIKENAPTLKKPPPPMEGGIINSKAISLPKPSYPRAAKAVRASGQVSVQVSIDENGNVTSATAISGHPLLRAAAAEAARNAKFSPTLLAGKPVKVSGVIVYNFIANNDESFKNSIGMEFVKIPGKTFYMGKYEVTQEEYEKIMGTNPSGLKNCPRCPVENVSWDDVHDFVKKLNAKNEGKYRLPSEAEFEYAMKGGETTAYYWGDDVNLAGEYAWYKSNSDNNPHEVGKKKPNKYGLYDIAGNVMEWCEDKWDATSTVRAVRGGSISSTGDKLRYGIRYSFSPSNYGNLLGFRLIREF